LLQLIVLGLQALELLFEVSDVGLAILRLHGEILEPLVRQPHLGFFLLTHSFSSQHLFLEYRDLSAHLASFLVVAVLAVLQLFLPVVFAETDFFFELLYYFAKVVDFGRLLKQLGLFVFVVHFHSLVLLSHLLNFFSVIGL
jgi:hypothetical protein